MRRRPQFRRAAAVAASRAQSALGPIILAAIAAALAWLIAHRLLGHQQPFFAPIAATISLSTSRIQRSRRSVQMVIGVLLGIGLAEVLLIAVGASTASLGLIVALTLAVAVAAGAGFIGEGMMFANQAAASAILVVTLHRAGTGSERAIDALIGGAVALALGVGLFPADPRALLDEAERTVLSTLAALLGRWREIDPSAADAFNLHAAEEAQRALGTLQRAIATAHANVRVAPRRWRLRASVDAECGRATRYHLLAGAVLGVIRAALAEPRPLAGEITSATENLHQILATLARAERPWSEVVLHRAHHQAGSLLGETSGRRSSALAPILAQAAADLAGVVQPSAWSTGFRAQEDMPRSSAR